MRAETVATIGELVWCCDNYDFFAVPEEVPCNDWRFRASAGSADEKQEQPSGSDAFQRDSWVAIHIDGIKRAKYAVLNSCLSRASSERVCVRSLSRAGQPSREAEAKSPRKQVESPRKQVDCCVDVELMAGDAEPADRRRAAL
jgi:hypothetical protein